MKFNTENTDIIDKYFDLVQSEIKKLISQDREIKPQDIQKFNNEIFNQPDDIKNEIKNYIDKSAMNNLDISKVAKNIYDKFKVQVKNNIFNQDDVNNVPNKLIGERRYIKTFEQFVNVNELTVKVKKLNDRDVQKILNNNINEFELFQHMKEKGTDKINKYIELYYDKNNNLIGYCILNNNFFKFDKNKIASFEFDKSEFNTLNIDDIDIKKSIRDDKSNPRYGTIIIKSIIENAKKKYDGITLQAEDDFLYNQYYPRFGFKPMNIEGGGGNAMVIWFDSKKLNEYSYFHTQQKIDDILQKIHDSGYQSLNDSEKAILTNFSKDDEDIHNLLLKMNSLKSKFKKLNVELERLNKISPILAKEKFQKEWLNLNTKMMKYENKLRYLYQIDDPKDIWDYMQKNNMSTDN